MINTKKLFKPDDVKFVDSVFDWVKEYCGTIGIHNVELHFDINDKFITSDDTLVGYFIALNNGNYRIGLSVRRFHLKDKKVSDFWYRILLPKKYLSGDNWKQSFCLCILHELAHLINTKKNDPENLFDDKVEQGEIEDTLENFDDFVHRNGWIDIMEELVQKQFNKRSKLWNLTK